MFEMEKADLIWGPLQSRVRCYVFLHSLFEGRGMSVFS